MLILITSTLVQRKLQLVFHSLSCCFPLILELTTGSLMTHCPSLPTGLTIQHCGNHGAMSTKPWVNKMMGLTDDLTGGSSLMWRYHHQVRAWVACAALGAGLSLDSKDGWPLQ